MLATNGDTHLGGDDIDNLLLNIALEDLQTEFAALQRERETVKKQVETILKMVEGLE